MVIFSRCRKVQKELVGYIQGALPGARRRTIREHLQTCQRCRIQERRLRTLLGVLEEVRPPYPPPDLLTKTRQKISSLGEEVSRPRFAWTRAFSLSIILLIALTLAISGLLVAHSNTAARQVAAIEQIQQTILDKQLIGEAQILTRELSELPDRLVLASVELILREVSNINPREFNELELTTIQRRLRESGIVSSLKALLQRSQGSQRKILSNLLSITQKIQNL